MGYIELEDTGKVENNNATWRARNGRILAYAKSKYEAKASPADMESASPIVALNAENSGRIFQLMALLVLRPRRIRKIMTGYGTSPTGREQGLSVRKARSTNCILMVTDTLLDML